MKETVRVCVVIPTYNESRTIGGLVSEVRQKGLDVVVVDDGSKDDTARIAEDRGATLIRNPKNLGKGASLKKGFEHALSNEYNTVIMMDGDGQHDTEDLLRFIEFAEKTEAELIVGNRMHDVRMMPVIRIWTNKFMSYVISRIAKQHIPDSQCGFRLLTKSALQKVELISLNYEIESEILIKASKRRLKILFLPIKTVYQGESSKINPIKDTIRFIKMLLNILRDAGRT